MRDPKDPQQWLLKDINLKSTSANPIVIVCSEKQTLNQIINLAHNYCNADAGGIFINNEISTGGVESLRAELDSFTMGLSVDQYLSHGLKESLSKDYLRTAL